MLGLIDYGDSDEDEASPRRQRRSSTNPAVGGGDEEDITELPEAPPSRISSSQQIAARPHYSASTTDAVDVLDEEWEGRPSLRGRGRPRDSEAWTDDESEPPPPKRADSMASPSPGGSAVPSPMVSVRTVEKDSSGRLPGNFSQTSLVSYGADDADHRRQSHEEDEFSRMEIAARGSEPTMRNEEEEDRPREPSPPPRPNAERGDKSEDDSPGEIEIDAVLEQAMALATDISLALPQQVLDLSSGTGSNTPRSMGDNDSPRIDRVDPKDIQIPPAPLQKSNPELQQLFEREFKKKSRGYDHNEMIQSRKDFANPSLYEKLLDHFEVDEYGSNFDKSVFDPSGFSADCYYDKLAEAQKRLMDSLPSIEKKQAAIAKAADAAKHRKSRFEESRKK